MPKFRKRFSKTEKMEIVRQSLDPEITTKELAKQYGIHHHTINRWRREYLQYEENAFAGHGNKIMTENEREIHELKKQLREAKLERDILKKAISIFSKGDRKYTNS